MAITAVALAAGSAFTYRYLKRQPATPAEQAKHPERGDSDERARAFRGLPTQASRLPTAAWLVLGIVMVAEVMDLLDSTITTIAAPTISSSLHGGPGLIKWLGASYALALGVLLVTGGRLGDKYGRRRTFLTGIGKLHRSLAGLRPGLGSALDHRTGPAGPGRVRRAAADPARRASGMLGSFSRASTPARRVQRLRPGPRAVGCPGGPRSGTAASAAELAPAMTLIGLGMGATFSTIYDTAIGDIDPAEA